MLFDFRLADSPQEIDCLKKLYDHKLMQAVIEIEAEIQLSREEHNRLHEWYIQESQRLAREKNAAKSKFV
jgi:hypothetical protein